MKESAIDVIAKPVETVEKAVKVLQLPDFSKDMLMNNLIKEGDLSRWGLANAVTALAHDDNFKAPDKAFSVEVAGRELITMSKKDWASLTA